MQENYEIGLQTCALSFINEEKCQIIEGTDLIQISMSLQDFLEYNCQYYGSSFEGRVKGSQTALGMKYKLPIVIEESREMVFFPTKAYNSTKCSWISLNNVQNYEKEKSSTLVTFSTGKKQLFEISFESFENQLLRASKLLLMLKSRKPS